MNIQLASDLHLEFLQRVFPGERLIAPAHGADVLVLAGDIANGVQAVKLFQHWPVPVLYVAGNHEYYNNSLDQMRGDIRRATEGTSVRFLDNEVADFGGVRFLGCTLWTDYCLFPDWSQSELMANAERVLNDHRLIQTIDGPFTAARALSEHETSREWLRRELDKKYDGKTIVVTHHGPHRNSIHPRYADDPTNAAFASSLEYLLMHANLWLHGHVHDSFDYNICGCRIVTNPLGYARNRYDVCHPRGLRFENEAFQWACVIDTSQ